MKPYYLPERLPLKGLGIRNLEAKLVDREGDTCFYKRSDGYYEVFIVKVRKASKVYGKDYPDREIYPGNEEFGQRAWCFRSFKEAEDKFNSLLNF